MSLQVLSKRCPGCEATKPATDFYRSRSTKDGYHSWCKVCSRAATDAAAQRRRAEMGEEAWLADKREKVARSRERRGMASEREYRKARKAATNALINNHRAEFDHLLLLARRGELSRTG